MNTFSETLSDISVSAGCHINDVMNCLRVCKTPNVVSAGCHINDVMNFKITIQYIVQVSAGCHINDVMNATVLHV